MTTTYKGGYHILTLHGIVIAKCLTLDAIKLVKAFWTIGGRI